MPCNYAESSGRCDEDSGAAPFLDEFFVLDLVMVSAEPLLAKAVPRVVETPLEDEVLLGFSSPASVPARPFPFTG